jgi:hypothetical protein
MGSNRGGWEYGEIRAAIITIYGRPDVRDALARGDWSVVLQALIDGGLSQTAIAARTGLSQSQVSRLAGGQSKTPGIKTVLVSPAVDATQA